MGRKKFRLLEPALAELRKAANHYKEIDPDLKADFIAKFNLSSEDIMDFPEAWACYYKDVRRYRIPRFPYRICYLIAEAEIVVVAIEHESRKPLYWHKRIKS